MEENNKMDREKREEVIRIIAYRIYQERQRLGIPGDALLDWLKAEKEYKEVFENDERKDC